ncbi:hypothetical protein LEN26_008177 [Aphanomyces euteiches]|nr:hypothetical protein AeMF1_019400 [Aphanomyces euteiches]KAH9130816.1 hypothetical protein LEN26_008177 [Aphanomyces euteiches]KAH9182778.1 hypothetical protein AeNC1_015245 [Aphanomyces euteiches]
MTAALYFQHLWALLATLSVAVVAKRPPSPVYLHRVEQLSDGSLFYRGQTYVRVQESLVSCEDAPYLAYDCSPTKFATAIVCVAVLVCLAGIMSGLTVGVLSLDKMHLTILRMEGSPTARAAAARLLPLLRNHRIVLVTLVLMNALANEALPIFLNTLINPVASVVFSVTVVVVFGEIVPTALCTGDRQLVIGAACVPLLHMFIRLAYPIAYPLALALNRTVGESSSNMQYSRNELKAMIQLQYETNPRAELSPDDVALLHGMLELGKLTAKNVMRSPPPESHEFMNADKSISSVELSTPLTTVLKLMLDSEVKEVLVVDSQERVVVGVVALADLPLLEATKRADLTIACLDKSSDDRLPLEKANSPPGPRRNSLLATNVLEWITHLKGDNSLRGYTRVCLDDEEPSCQLGRPTQCS